MTQGRKARVTLVSFGFKYGLPNANYYFDVGFLQNPARDTRWGFFSTPDEGMREFVLQQDRAQKFIKATAPLLIFLAGIDQNQIFAFGCNAGRHRSSILVDELARRLAEADIDVEVLHRDHSGT